MSGPGSWQTPHDQTDPETADGPRYDPRTDTYVEAFDHRSASVAVVESLADIRHCDTTDIEPLYRSMDPDALDALVDSASGDLRVRLVLDGFEVVVTGACRLEITPPS